MSRIVQYQDLCEILERGEDLNGISVIFGCKTCSPIWAATVCADQELLSSLLAHAPQTSCYIQVNEINSESGCYPLHCAAKLGQFDMLQLLVEAKADVNAQNHDLFGLGASGFKLLPECGGQTTLHLLCAMRESEEQMDACSTLLKARADLRITDNLGLRAHDLATANANTGICRLLEQSGAVKGAGCAKAEILQLCKAREAQWKSRQLAERRLERQQSLSWIKTSYHPKDARLYTADFISGRAAQVLGCQPASDQEPSNELAPGVFCVDNLLPAELCAALLDELDAFGIWATSSSFAIARPNSMNRYGMVLNDIGFQHAMHALMEQVVAPLSKKLFGRCLHSEDGRHRSFSSQHSFVVRYRVGEDEDLKTHVDDSDVTLNVCLGKDFDGAGVYFHAPPTSLSGAQMSCSCMSEQEKEQEYIYPHPADCKFCTFKHAHVPGRAILHLGRHVHGVDKLLSGERINLIIWCRFRPYPPEMDDISERTSISLM